MALGVAMRVSVLQALVAMAMFVGEVAAKEKFVVGEDLLGGALGDQPVLLAEDVDPVGDEIHRVQVMGGGDDRVARLVELADEIEEPTLGTGVEASRGLVEEPDLRMQGEDGGYGYLLLLSLAEAMGGSIPQALYPQESQRLFHPANHLFLI